MTVKAIKLKPGWLRRDIERAIAKCREWEKNLTVSVKEDRIDGH